METSAVLFPSQSYMIFMVSSVYFRKCFHLFCFIYVFERGVSFSLLFRNNKHWNICLCHTHDLCPFFFKYNFAVPPNIEDSLTSTDVVVREGANVTLKCRATGSPIPSVKWKRDDNSKISISKAMSGILLPHTSIGLNKKTILFSVVEWEGETLEMSKISRLDMGAYLCIASNGVPPSVSKRIKVSVDCKCKIPSLWKTKKTIFS